jgi:hypothetical protein
MSTKDMQNRKLVVVRVLAIVFLFVGLVGWLVPFFPGRAFRSHTELPNSEPHGIAIDKEGNIYCGSAFYGRIQKYDPNGRFLRGFDTHGGTGMGTDFGFYTEDLNLCILISGLARSQKDSFYRLTVYDSKGNVLSTEKYTKPGTDYFYPVNNRVADSAGNIYLFKGFLFPRVIRTSENGAKSAIIKTPLWLWFFQAPFPSFAFFFVSMFIIIFLAKEAVLLKATVAYFSKRENLRKVIRTVLVVIGLALVLILLIFRGLKTYPMIVIFGLVSFAIMLVLVGLVSLVYALKRTWHYRKHYPEFSGKWTTGSMRERLEFGRAIREKTATDPLLCKMDAKMSKFVKLWFLIWLILFLLVSSIVIFAHVVRK